MELEELEYLKPYLKTIIKECIDDCLFERELNEAWSLSNPIDAEADRVFKLLFKIYKIRTKPNDKRDYLEYVGSFPIDIFGKKILLKYRIFDFKKECSFIFDPDENYFDGLNNIISLSFSVKNGEVNLPKIYDVFSHEISHMYEFIRETEGMEIQQNTNNEAFPEKVYSYVMQHMNDFGNDGFNSVIAVLFYYSSQDEQDAYIGGFASELKKLNAPPEEILENTQFYRKLIDYKQKLQLFRNPGINRTKLMAAVQPYAKYGYDYNKLNRLFTSRYDRLNKKKDLIMMLYSEWFKQHNRAIYQDNIKTNN